MSKSDKTKNMSKETKAVHAGTNPSKNAVNTPVYLSSTFYLDEKGYQDWANMDPDMMVYTRLNNPSQEAAASKIAALEGAEKGLVFSSGLAAIHATITALMKKGDKMVTTADIYGGTYAMFKEDFTELGIESIFVDLTDLENAKRVFEEEEIKPKIIYLEPISNPTLKIFDIEGAAKMAHEYGALLVVDNTFATPMSLNPIKLGADIVIHSVTKYLNGHSDMVGGAVVGSNELMNEVWKKLVHFGGCLDPHACYLLERGMRTLHVRMERTAENALKIAKWLEAHPKISKVYYPGLESHPQYELSKKMLKMGGGMISFVVGNSDEEGMNMVRKCKIPLEATSLGGVESLIEMPGNTSHMNIPEEERKEIGIVPGFVRLSVGIENVDDLIADFSNALESN